MCGAADGKSKEKDTFPTHVIDNNHHLSTS